jgi:murein L,D-transpeptidase YcbB/YkuD
VARNPQKAARDGYVKEGTRYRQKPGPANNLGRMKLDFVNPYSIGIHDTPARGLFARDKRALSHGCIRVDDPLGFAATLLGGDVTREALAAMLPGGQTQRLAFAAPIPVIIGYFTAEVDDTGVVLIHNDIYRLDRQEPAAASQDAESECAV